MSIARTGTPRHRIGLLGYVVVWNTVTIRTFFNPHVEFTIRHRSTSTLSDRLNIADIKTLKIFVVIAMRWGLGPALSWTPSRSPHHVLYKALSRGLQPRVRTIECEQTTTDLDD
ncbi:hypothetical protein BS47DRAFT_886241 [Hydnum rufescens UP504]|uniref:Uncharacterized protein n=1 Tax=Hydnum rufescens UP504 TaxID=1448309 RepID=A0A9P6AYG0_9AGAM|nr:hypothetical protein BS47DRAFT_886241 [Hydnum rufescens UP504]